MKEDMSLSNLGTVAIHAPKVSTNVFSSTLICILTLDYERCLHAVCECQEDVNEITINHSKAFFGEFCVISLFLRKLFLGVT